MEPIGAPEIFLALLGRSDAQVGRQGNHHDFAQ